MYRVYTRRNGNLTPETHFSGQFFRTATEARKAISQVASHYDFRKEWVVRMVK